MKCYLFQQLPTSFYGFRQNMTTAPYGLRVVEERLRLSSRRPCPDLRGSQESRALRHDAIHWPWPPPCVFVQKVGVQSTPFSQCLHVRTDRGYTGAFYNCPFVIALVIEGRRARTRLLVVQDSPANGESFPTFGTHRSSR